MREYDGDTTGITAMRLFCVKLLLSKLSLANALLNIFNCVIPRKLHPLLKTFGLPKVNTGVVFGVSPKTPYAVDVGKIVIVYVFASGDKLYNPLFLSIAKIPALPVPAKSNALNCITNVEAE